MNAPDSSEHPDVEELTRKLHHYDVHLARNFERVCTLGEEFIPWVLALNVDSLTKVLVFTSHEADVTALLAAIETYFTDPFRRIGVERAIKACEDGMTGWREVFSCP